MEKVIIEIFPFIELAPPAQARAIKTLGHINVDENWWDSVYCDFEQIAAILGVTVDLSRTFFSGMDGQGGACNFQGSVDVLRLIEAVEQKAWKEYAPVQEFNFPVIGISPHVLRLLKNGAIRAGAKVRSGRRDISVQAELVIDYSYNLCLNYDNIETALEDLEGSVNGICQELNRFLYGSLKRDYEWRVSDETVRETLLEGERRFLEDGREFLL